MNYAYNFVIQLRKILENDKLNINKWLDLIFGVKQRGEKAEEANNLYMGNSYQGNVKIDSFKDIDTRNTLMRLVEVGVTPLQLFDVECKPKIEKDILLTKDPLYSNNKGNRPQFELRCSFLDLRGIENDNFYKKSHFTPLNSTKSCQRTAILSVTCCQLLTLSSLQAPEHSL